MVSVAFAQQRAKLPDHNQWAAPFFNEATQTWSPGAAKAYRELLALSATYANTPNATDQQVLTAVSAAARGQLYDVTGLVAGCTPSGISFGSTPKAVKGCLWFTADDAVTKIYLRHGCLNPVAVYEPAPPAPAGKDTTMVAVAPGAVMRQTDDTCHLALSITVVSPTAGNCDGYLSVLPSGGNGWYVYEWVGYRDTTLFVYRMDQSMQRVCQGVYNVEVHDSAGCVGKATVVVEPVAKQVDTVVVPVPTATTPTYFQGGYVGGWPAPIVGGYGLGFSFGFNWGGFGWPTCSVAPCCNLTPPCTTPPSSPAPYQGGGEPGNPGGSSGSAGSNEPGNPGDPQDPGGYSGGGNRIAPAGAVRGNATLPSRSNLQGTMAPLAHTAPGRPSVAGVSSGLSKPTTPPGIVSGFAKPSPTHGGGPVSGSVHQPVRPGMPPRSVAQAAPAGAVRGNATLPPSRGAMGSYSSAPHAVRPQGAPQSPATTRPSRGPGLAAGPQGLAKRQGAPGLGKPSMHTPGGGQLAPARMGGSPTIGAGGLRRH